MSVETDNKRKFEESDLDTCIPPNKKIQLDLDGFLCPITKQIFNIPVFASDGNIYEKWALEKILNGRLSTKSPISREMITHYYEDRFVKNLVQEFLKENPECKKFQFENKSYTNFSENTTFCLKILKQNNFSRFAEFENIFISEDSGNDKSIIEYISIDCKNYDNFKKILDNCIDLNTRDSFGNVPLYYIFKYSSLEMILYAMGKGAEINKLDQEQNSLIHLMNEYQSRKLCREEEVELLKYLIDNDLCRFNRKNAHGITEFKIINGRYPEIMKYFLNKFREMVISEHDENLFVLLDPSFLCNAMLYFGYDEILPIFELLRFIIKNIDRELIMKEYDDNNLIDSLCNLQFQLLNDLNDNGHLDNLQISKTADEIMKFFNDEFNVFDMCDKLNFLRNERKKKDIYAKRDDLLEEIKKKQTDLQN